MTTEHLLDTKTLRTVDLPMWREILSAGPVRFTIVDDGMAPTLRPGDTVLLSPLNTGLLPGDVGVYSRLGQLVVHRYLGSGRFRGDNRLCPDPPVPRTSIVARVTEVFRDGEFVAIKEGIPLRVRFHRAIVHLRHLLRGLRRAHPVRRFRLWFARMIAPSDIEYHDYWD